MDDNDKTKDELIAELIKLREDNSKMNLILDESEKVKIELSEKEQNFSTLFEYSATPIWIEDFSEIKKRFEQLKQDGINDFNEYFNSHPGVVAEMSGLVKVIDVNELSVKLLGAKDKESLIENLPSYFNKESLEVFKNQIISLAEGNDRFASEIPVFPQSGEKIYVGIILSVPKLYKDTLEIVIISFFDITPIKLAEESLTESEKKFHSIWDKSTDGMRLTDEQGIVVLANDSYCKLIEKSKEEILGKPISIVYEKKRHSEILRKHQERFRARSIPESLERELTLWNGKKVFLELSNTFLENENQPTTSLSIFRDITERKLAEQNLLESEEKFRFLTENSRDMIYKMNIEEGFYEYVSPASIDLFGYAPKEFYDTPVLIQKIIHPDWLNYFEEELVKLEVGEISPTYEYQIIHKSGETRWLHQRNVLIKDTSGKPLSIEGVVTDITERKNVEEKYKESEGMLKSVFRAAPTGIGVIVNRNIIFVNQKFADMMGYSSEELINHNSRMVYATDEEYEWVGKEKYDQIQKYGTGTVETILLRKDGKLIDVLLSSTPIDLDDLSKGVTFTALDITERKMNDIRLKVKKNIKHFMKTLPYHTNP